MPKSCLVGIDIGTSRVKALVFDLDGRELSDGHVETPWRITSSGAEAEPDELYKAVLDAVRLALRATPEGTVAGVGVTGMAEAVALLGKRGEAVAPTIAWFDERGEEERTELERDVGDARFAALTGLPVSRLATIVKLRWMLRHFPDAPSARCMLSVPEYIAYRLGGERAAEPSLASRTGLFDVNSESWSAELLEWVGLPDDVFPDAVAAGSVLGRVVDRSSELERLRGAAIALGGHDHLCAAVGSGVISQKEVLNSCGTAEAYVRSVAPLDGNDLIAAVANGVCVGRHVLPNRQAILGGRPFGLVLAPVYDLLGWSDVSGIDAASSERTRDEAADMANGESAGEGAHGRLGVALSFSFDVVTGRSSFTGIGPGVSAKRARAVAIEEVLRRSFKLYEAVAGIGGPVERVVMTGGWARSEPLATRKAERFPAACWVTVREPGARGAALFAGHAAGLLSGPEGFPAAPLELS
jgi:sugar (pentulose or hexulose) kinase